MLVGTVMPKKSAIVVLFGGLDLRVVQQDTIWLPN